MGFFRDKGGNRRIYSWRHEKRWFLMFFNHRLRFEYGRVPGLRWLKIRWGGGYVDGFQWTAGIGYGCWLTWEMPWALRWRIPGMKHHDAREVGFSWFSGILRLLLGREAMGAHYGERNPFKRILKNREVTLFNWEWIVGRDKYTKYEGTSPRLVNLNVGEWADDQYDVLISLERCSWQNRIRTIRRSYWEFRVPEGCKAPVIPGKGENSWDIDDDGIYGISFDAADDSPLDRFRERVIESRRRYGGANWRPHELVNQ